MLVIMLTVGTSYVTRLCLHLEKRLNWSNIFVSENWLKILFCSRYPKYINIYILKRLLYTRLWFKLPKSL